MNTSIMTAKEYLSQAFHLDQFINSKLMQVQSYRELATKTTSVIADARRADSPELQRTAELVARIVDAEAEINEAIDELVDLKREIAHVIGEVENRECRLLLELRYLCFQPWEQIAVALGYSIQHTYRMHGLALDAVNIQKDESKCESM